MPRLRARFIAASRLWLLTGVALACVMAVTLSSFRVLEESVAEERKAKIRATVETAHSLLARYGAIAEAGEMPRDEAQQAAIKTVRALRYADGEYFWINDLGPRMIMHATRPDLEGSDLTDYSDPDGKRFIVEVVRTARADHRVERWRGPGFE